MPSPSRPSPRAVIEDWLSHTEETRKVQAHGSSSRNKHKGRRKHHEQRYRNAEDLRLRARPGRQRIETTVYDGVSGEAENLYPPAQHLGLRTPFRALDGNQKQLAEEGVAIAVPKRKRGDSCTSTCLRPSARRRSVEEAGNHKDLEDPKPAGQAAQSDEKLLQSSSHRRQSFAVALKSFENYPKSYERKSRRKTREDHYTLKETQNAPNQNADEGKNLLKKRGKRKRREKSGSALMHDFNAHNVAFNRLTLRSAPAVGIFSKGRASSPIKRRGLPDLAFSEATFLKSHKEKPENLGKPLERVSRRKKGRIADDRAEISRYFTSINASLPQRMVPEVESLASLERCRLGSDGEDDALSEKWRPTEINPRLPLLELPATPFLGFGSSGVAISSPVKLHQSSTTPNRSAHAQDRPLSPKKPDQSLNTQNRTPHSPTHHASPTRTTTYYTWSRSRALSQNSLAANSPRQTPSTSGLNHESRPENEPVMSYANRNQDIRMQHPSGDNHPHHEYRTDTHEAEKQSRTLDAGLQSVRALKHVEPKDQPQGRGEEDKHKSHNEVKNKSGSANSRVDTPLTERAPIVGTHASPTSHPFSLNKTASFKSLDAAIDRLNQRFMETPRWRAEKSTHPAVSRCGPESQKSCSISKESPSKVRALQHDRTGCKNVKSYANTADSASCAGPSYAPSAPRIQAPQILPHQGRQALEPFPSISMLDRPQPYGHGLRKLSGLRTRAIKRPDTPAIYAWPGYDRLYESQEDPRDKLSSGSVHCMQGHTPVQTLCSDEFLASKEQSPRPNQDFNSCKHREKVRFQHIEERSPDSNSLLNEYPEIWHGTTYQTMYSPASQDHFLNAGDQDGRQTYQDYSQNEQSALGGDAGLEEGQKYPFKIKINIAEQSRDSARQNYPLYAPDAEETHHPWNAVVPSHTNRSSFEFQGITSPVPSNEEKGVFAGFWKPHLLY